MKQELVCRRAPAPLTVDGDLGKTVWNEAERTPRFSAVDSGDLGFFDTRSALLWDERALYAGFWLEERDIYCTGNERTGLTWSENTIELYIAGHDAYYTLAITPDGRCSEMFFIWKDAYPRGSRYDVPEFDLAVHKPMVFGGDSGPHHERGMRWGFFDWHFPGLEFAVKVDGTLNQRRDIDRGWQVEIALPWQGLSRLLEGPLPTLAGTELSIACARCQMVEHRATSFAAVWTPHPMPSGGLHIPESYPQWRLVD